MQGFTYMDFTYSPLVILFKMTVTNMTMPMTMKMLSMPIPIYRRLRIKLNGVIFIVNNLSVNIKILRFSAVRKEC